MAPGGVRFLFRSFQRILGLNTRVLERMALMDRALGGEYVFDSAFLAASVRDVCRLTHLVAYHLNGMADEGLVALYDAYLGVKDALEDILAGGMGPLAGRRVLPFSELDWELEPLAGLCAVGLAVLGRRMGLPAPDGLAVTATGMAVLAGPPGPARDAAEAEVAAAVLELYSRLGGACGLELTLSAAGPAGAGRVLAESRAASAPEAARIARELAAAHAAEGPAALCVRPWLAGAARGTLQTLAHDPSLPPAMLAVAQADPDAISDAAGPEGQDRSWISRTAPHRPLRTRPAVKPADAALPGGRPLSPVRGRLRRGSAWLLPETAALLAELGLAAERALSGPCVLAWVLDEDGGLRLTGVAPVRTAFPDWTEDADTDGGADAGPDAADLLLRGGQIACSGVGAGPVVLVDDDTDPAAVPLGSVGVARTASPALARLAPRLGALLAELGTAASHLATVAREHRVPAVFGLRGAAALPEGGMVTVDAEAGEVWRGVAEGLLRQDAVARARQRTDPEFLVLRRLLRFVRPLNLVDPADPGFRPERCRTCHDIIHFAHERAVELLLESNPGLDPARRGGLGAPHRLTGDTPLEMRVLDLGGGLTPAAAARPGDIAPEDVASRPLRAFLEGLRLPGARREGPGRLGLGDILSGAGRTGRALSAPPASLGAGMNLALAAADYANITLRLGYHFSVVDAVVSDRPEHTFVYFRFAGGFAADDRRARRAGLILAVLERLGFRASRQGDLVVGKRRLLEAEAALGVLRVLGALSTYTRQLDTELDSEAEAVRRGREFLEALGLGPDADADADPDADFDEVTP
ncbi:MAG: PEP-utilizing enzyme [Desulfovibrionaceae bacterium]